MSFAIIGSTEAIRDLLCGEQQYREHCLAWRWNLYMQDVWKRDAHLINLREAERKIIAEAYARKHPEYQLAAE